MFCFFGNKKNFSFLSFEFNILEKLKSVQHYTYLPYHELLFPIVEAAACYLDKFKYYAIQ